MSEQKLQQELYGRDYESVENENGCESFESVIDENDVGANPTSSWASET